MRGTTVRRGGIEGGRLYGEAVLRGTTVRRGGIEVNNSSCEGSEEGVRKGGTGARHTMGHDNHQKSISTAQLALRLLGSQAIQGVAGGL